MSLDVRIATEDERDRWDKIVHRSPHGQIFHQYEALRVQATHADTELYPLVGFAGEEPVGVFPVFERTKGPFGAAVSPSPLLSVPYLGPALIETEAMKRRTAERRHRQFVNGCLDWIRNELDVQYIYIRTNRQYDDVRPFQWNGCTVTPLFTYVVDLDDDTETVKMRFSSDLRSNIKSVDDAGTDLSIEVGGMAEADLIIDRVRERLDKLDVTFRVPTSFGAQLLETLPDGQVKPYVCRIDGEFVGGLLVVQYDNTVYRWLGGNKPPADVDIPVNDLLDWRVMTDAMDQDISRYDLVGADNPRTNRYKSKFNPEIATYYRIEGGPWHGRRLVDLYKKLQPVALGLFERLQ